MTIKHFPEIDDQLMRPVPKTDLESRRATGTAVHYLKNPYHLHHLDLIFHANNWDLEIINSEISINQIIKSEVYNKETKNKEIEDRILIVTSAKVRLTVRFPDGSSAYRDGQGTASFLINPLSATIGDQIETLIKSAETDAGKRAAAKLGNAFGRGLDKNGKQVYVIEADTQKQSYPVAENTNNAQITDRKENSNQISNSIATNTNSTSQNVNTINGKPLNNTKFLTKIPETLFPEFKSLEKNRSLLDQVGSNKESWHGLFRAISIHIESIQDIEKILEFASHCNLLKAWAESEGIIGNHNPGAKEILGWFTRLDEKIRNKRSMIHSMETKIPDYSTMDPNF